MSVRERVRDYLFSIAALLLTGDYAYRVNTSAVLPQCFHYRNLSESFRRYVPGPKTARMPRCDDNFHNPIAWYRFTGAAGNKMRASYVRHGKCGTVYPGWLRGAHPRYVNTTNDKAEVCFDIHSNNSCGLKVPIRITNCPGFYVYRLPRITTCSKVYCTESGTYVGLVQASSTAGTPSLRPSSSTERVRSVPRPNQDGRRCQKEKYDGIIWPATKVGKSVTRRCSAGKGYVTRRCSTSGWKDVNTTSCRSLEIDSLYEQARNLRGSNVSRAARTQVAEYVIERLANATAFETTNGSTAPTRLSGHELVFSVDILHDVILLNVSVGRLSILQPASNILDRKNKKSWDELKNSTEVVNKLVVSVEDYGFKLGNDLENTKEGKTKLLATLNVELGVKSVQPGSNSTSHYTKFDFQNSFFDLSPNAIQTVDNSTATVVVVHYRTLHSILGRGKFPQSKNYKISSKVITASVRPRPRTIFEKPVRINWKKKYVDTENAKCAFFQPENATSVWSSEGCRKIERREDDHVICECNHLTAFAVMDISDGILPDRERRSLEMISTIGCSLSLLGVLLTVVSHALLWNKLHATTKTEVRPRVLMHLCVAVGLTDIFAIMAGPLLSNKMFCTVVSISLYFSVLAVFGWMLCEGIVIYLQLVRVYTGLGGRHLRVFYAIGWGTPVTVAALSVALTDRRDFVSEHACWFRAKGPLLWTFVASAGTTLMVNIAVLVLVLRSMFSSHIFNRAGVLNRAKAGMKATAVLLPLLGLTWLFGLLVFNSDTLVFKYLFAIFNSLQGLMIFFFHVLFNKQIREVVRKERGLRKTRSQVALNGLTANQKCGTLSINVGNNYQRTSGTDASLPREMTVPNKSLNRPRLSKPLVLSNCNNNNDNNHNFCELVETDKNKREQLDISLEDLEAL